jgi:hypothetical protein
MSFARWHTDSTRAWRWKPCIVLGWWFSEVEIRALTANIKRVAYSLFTLDLIWLDTLRCLSCQQNLAQLPTAKLACWFSSWACSMSILWWQLRDSYILKYEGHLQKYKCYLQKSKRDLQIGTRSPKIKTLSPNISAISKNRNVISKSKRNLQIKRDLQKSKRNLQIKTQSLKRAEYELRCLWPKRQSALLAGQPDKNGSVDKQADSGHAVIGPRSHVVFMNINEEVKNCQAIRRNRRSQTRQQSHLWMGAIWHMTVSIVAKKSGLAIKQLNLLNSKL